MSKARTTTGTTFTLGTQTYSVEITSVGQEGMNNTEVDATHLSSTVVETIIDELTDHGSLTFATNIDPNELPNLKTAQGVPQEGTLTFKTTGTETAGATIVGQCAIVEHDFDGEVRAKIAGTFRVRWLGDVVYTAATST